MLNRRELLIGSASAWALATLPSPSYGARLVRPRFSAYPFTLGVASGDPTPSGAVLWTRLAPDPLRGGGMPSDPVEVEWLVAEDEALSRVVQRGSDVATADLAHTVHTEVDGLAPERWYWYQFRSGGEYSPLGRTRTAPETAAANARLSFGFCSCNHYEQGYFTAYRHMAEEELDLVFHLGDYIYEYEGREDRVRMHTYGELASLDDYRNRYALYKADPDFQAVHAAVPFVVTADDHEVDNNYAGSVSEHDDPVAPFLQRRAHAYKAYWEHMPLRRAALPDGPDIQLFRKLDFGSLAGFFVLDTRQYRTDQPCGDRSGPRCPQVFDEQASLMGPAQESWLFNGMDGSPARWNIIPQQVMVAPVDQRPGAEERYSMDQWSGYDAARNRLVEFLADRQPDNPVVLTGDIHSNWVNDLKADFTDPASATVGTELVVTSISSGGDGEDVGESTAAVLAENPFVKFFNGQRGYVTCELTRDALRADYRVVPYVSQPDAPISTRASFLIESGRPGAQRL